MKIIPKIYLLFLIFFLKEALRQFHKFLSDKLGVMKPDLKEIDFEGPTDANLGEDGGLSNAWIQSLSITHPSSVETLSMASFSMAFPPDELQMALTNLSLIPPEIGNPEEGSGKPPRLFKYLWTLITRQRYGLNKDRSGLKFDGQSSEKTFNEDSIKMKSKSILSQFGQEGWVFCFEQNLNLFIFKKKLV